MILCTHAPERFNVSGRADNVPLTVFGSKALSIRIFGVFNKGFAMSQNSANGFNHIFNIKNLALLVSRSKKCGTLSC